MCKDTDRKFVRIVENLVENVDSCNVVTCRFEDDALLVRCPTNKIIPIVDEIKSITDVTGIAEKSRYGGNTQETRRYLCM